MRRLLVASSVGLLQVALVSGARAQSSAAPAPENASPSPTPAPAASPTPTTAPAASATPAPAAVPPTPAPTAPPPGPIPPPPAPPTGPDGPPSGERPLYYVEPPDGAPPPNVGYYEPPPPMVLYEPPPPPPLPRNAPPRTAFWVGARAAWFIPFGSLWLDGYDDGAGRYFRRRTFADYASSGPAFEIDVGARLDRRYNVFALWEHATLGTGSLDPDAYGGQNRGYTNLYAVGLRFSTDPASVGFAMELTLGYRDFGASWSNGTQLSLTDGWLDARIGMGADVRLSPHFSVTPMIVLGGGQFGSARWSGPDGNRPALDYLDSQGQYGTVSLQVGAHADIF